MAIDEKITDEKIKSQKDETKKEAAKTLPLTTGKIDKY